MLFINDANLEPLWLGDVGVGQAEEARHVVDRVGHPLAVETLEQGHLAKRGGYSCSLLEDTDTCDT